MDKSMRTVLPPKPKKLYEKADEVRRRKEAAERLMKERHEAIRREREEKFMKINEERLRQQRELKERHARELKRQQDVLQRRMALMERDNARKKEILERNHAAVSRLASGPSRKKYAFGSSTPRELSFVECRQSKSQDRQPLRDKQVLSNGTAHGQHGRSANSIMSTSMYVPTDSNRQSISTVRSSPSKSAVTKSQNLMTQSVYSPSPKVSVTPTSRLQKKPLNRLANSASNSSLVNSPATPGSKSKTARLREAKSKPKMKSVGLKSQNRLSSSAEQPNEAAVVSNTPSEHSDATVPMGDVTSECLHVETMSDEISSKILDNDTHIEEDVDTVLVNDDIAHEGTQMMSDSSEDEVVKTSEEAVEVREIVEFKVIIPEDSDVNEVIRPSVELPHDTTDSSIQKRQIVEVDEMSGCAQSPFPQSSAVIDSINHPRASPVDNSSMEEPTKEPRSEEITENPHSEDRIVEFLPEDEVEKQAKESLGDECAGDSHHENRVINFLSGNEVEEQVKEPLSKELTEQLHCENRVFEFLPEGEVGKQVDEVISKGTDRNPHYEKRPEEFSLKSEDESSKENKGQLIEETAEDKYCESQTNGTVPEVKSINVSADQTAGMPLPPVENMYDKQFTPIIPGDIPGTVPTTKETDDSMVKKPPSPTNEIIAHRLRREQEQRELDERKARIAAILAKSRDLSSAASVVIGRSTPSRGEAAQDLLKRLASNGNLPSLQKLVARHASGSSAMDQVTQEDPTPQAI
ncbi:hypothetical protein KIN20_005859 [Parelaphostrongylus tenuis]|uniref:Uncharacterized protein n=1 Tax=Parelaphostrongylus tenuis TaxID=148309 RepID=A0AAD5M3W9_PARTN|nr:hypothetical protein KIN20_005859 [Parelaphostrongylus tenuis]